MKFILFALLLFLCSGCEGKVYSLPGINLYLPEINEEDRYNADEYDNESEEGMISGG